MAGFFEFSLMRIRKDVDQKLLAELFYQYLVLWYHRALATLLGAILRLGPVKRALATNQVKSRYLEALALRFS